MAAAEEQKTPYWNVNADPSQWTDECPEWMTSIDDYDKFNLGTKDADFQPMDWDHVKQLVASNRIDRFRRVPSNLRRYLLYVWKLKQKYGSVLRFIVDERLKWADLTPKDPMPFVEPDDYKFLLNDWPYGVTPGIVHLVVWVKFKLEEDPTTGDITGGTRASIDAFVAETFHPHVAPEDVLWFRNWSALKSIHAVEHFHVMLNNPDPAFIHGITNGDVAMIDKV